MKPSERLILLEIITMSIDTMYIDVLATGITDELTYYIQMGNLLGQPYASLRDIALHGVVKNYITTIGDYISAQGLQTAKEYNEGIMSRMFTIYRYKGRRYP